MGFPGGSDSKRICMQCKRPGFDPWVGEIPLEKGMAIHCSSLAWRIPWTEEPGGYSLCGHKQSDTAEKLTLSLFTFKVALMLKYT